MTFNQNKCPNCGAEIQISANNEQAFCQYCGCNLLNESSQDSSLKAVKLINQAKDFLDAKDYDGLKAISKQIQELAPDSFYGWFYEAICIKEAPVEGTLGKVMKGLETFSTALMKSAMPKKSKKAKRIELQGKGVQMIGILSKENFMGRILKASRNIETNNQDEKKKQLDMLFGLLNDMTEVMWTGLMQKTYTTTNKKHIIKEHETQLSNYFLSFDKEMRKTTAGQTEEYKNYMSKNMVQYLILRYSLNYFTETKRISLRKDMKKLAKEYYEYASKKLKKKLIITIIKTAIGICISIYIITLICTLIYMAGQGDLIDFINGIM